LPATAVRPLVDANLSAKDRVLLRHLRPSFYASDLAKICKSRGV
jgi:hypothetical protein